MDSWFRLLSRLRLRLLRPSGYTRLVQGLAQTLVGRPLEGEQAAALAIRLEDEPAAIQSVVADLLRLPEARQYAAAPLLLDVETINSRTCFISLGTHCFTASLLQRWGLRAWSGPFDWLFASPRMLTHALGDDFAMLLDRSQYRPVPPEQRVDGPEVNRVDHAFYRSQHGVAFVFNHHDVHLSEGHAYLVRCVERLRAQLRAETHKTFLLIRRAELVQLPDILALRQALAVRSRNFRLCVFAVAPGNPGVLPRADALHADETLSVWRYHPTSAWQALHFESPMDEAAILRLAAPPPL